MYMYPVHSCRFPFRVPAYYALILRSLTVLEGLALQADPK
jgi:predicted unusual protein kinase regulating ubiquinone biosynthesis (AarF/ABC1/UbiB family)